MLVFDEQQIRQSVEGALHLKTKIEQYIDLAIKNGVKNVCFLGIGGTLASSMQVHTHMLEKTNMEVICQSAAEYLTTGNRRISEGTLMVVSSVSGTTKEIVAAVTKAKKDGVTVFGFIDNLSSS